MFRSGRAIALGMMAIAACAGQSGRVAADADIRSATSGPAHVPPFDAVPTASLDQLGALRGGLRVGALDVEFAANVRTLVNGALVLESTVGNAQFNAPTASLSGLTGQMGVVIEDSSGVTTALHSVTREQILGAIFTTASNQQIRQEINVEVTVANFGRFQDAARSALFTGRLVGSLLAN